MPSTDDNIIDFEFENCIFTIKGHLLSENEIYLVIFNSVFANRPFHIKVIERSAKSDTVKVEAIYE